MLNHNAQRQLGPQTHSKRPPERPPHRKARSMTGTVPRGEGPAGGVPRADLPERGQQVQARGRRCLRATRGQGRGRGSSCTGPSRIKAAVRTFLLDVILRSHSKAQVQGERWASPWGSVPWRPRRSGPDGEEAAGEADWGAERGSVGCSSPCLQGIVGLAEGAGRVRGACAVGTFVNGLQGCFWKLGRKFGECKAVGISLGVWPLQLPPQLSHRAPLGRLSACPEATFVRTLF